MTRSIQLIDGIIHQKETEMKTNGSPEIVADLADLRAVRHILHQLKTTGVNPHQVRHALKIPPSSTAHSEFRVMDDCDTEEREHWLEASHDGEPIRISAGDILLTCH